MDEIWKEVPSFPMVEVSSLGKVRRKDNKIEKSLYTDKQGYRRVGIWIKDKTVVVRVHQLMAEAFLDTKTDRKTVVNHIDGSKTNNLLENLEICSCRENSIHAVNLGLAKSCENNYNSLLENWQVVWIHLMSIYGFSHNQIRETFGLPKRYSISRVISGNRWKNIYKLLYNKK